MFDCNTILFVQGIQWVLYLRSRGKAQTFLFQDVMFHFRHSDLNELKFASEGMSYVCLQDILFGWMHPVNNLLKYESQGTAAADVG